MQNRVFFKLTSLRCLSISLLFIFLSIKSTAQFNAGNCPNNIDFEFGDFTNWTFGSGTTNAGPTYAWSGTAQLFGIHNIIPAATNAGVLDPYGNFPIVCPNGSGYSVKLGNEVTGTGKAQKITYIFTIPAGSVRYSLTYYYAAVLNRGATGSHNSANQPRFTVSLKDANTNLDVGCSYYDYNAEQGTANGFQLSTLTGGSGNAPVYYKTWTPVTIDLSGLNGTTIKLEFVTNNCAPGGHFGYAYIDVGATCITPVTGYAYCTGATSITLTAPFGYQSYNWLDAGGVVSLGTNQTLTISPPPPNGTVLNVDLIPFPFGGCRDTLPVFIEEQAQPDTPVAISNYVYCINQPATQLTATGLPGYLLQWYTTPTGGTPSLNAPFPNTSVAAVTDYYVSQLSFGGCEGPRKKITVTVNAPPTPNFSINDTTQCFAGNNFICTNISPTAGTSYNWNFGDGPTIITATNATHQYTTTGNYTITLTAVTGTCSLQFTIPIEVTISPVANFTAANGCEATPVNFINTTTGGSAANQYTWDFGGGNTSTLANPTYTFTTPGVKTVKLKVVDGTCTDEITKTVTIYEVPKTNFTYNSACVNDTIQFTDLSLLSTGVVTNWNWDFGNGQTASIKNPKMAFTTFGPQNVKLTASTAFCSKDTTIVVSVYEKPIANFKRIDSACLNQLVQFRDSSYYASGAPSNTITTWWWDAGNGAIYSSGIVNPTYASVNTFLVQQVVTSVNGCSSDTNKVLVNVKPLPTAQVNFLSNLCELRPLNFEDVSTPNILGRNWIFSNGFVSNAKKITVPNLLRGTNNLKLQVTDSFGCKSIPLDSTFMVNKKPYMDFDYKDSCLERPVPFEAFDADVNYITNWYWNFEGSTRSGAINDNHQFAKYGNNNIYAYGVAANGCVSDTSYKTVNLRYNPAYAGADKIAAAGEAVQLNGTGGISYEWTPSTGLNNPLVQSPIATNTTNRNYRLKVTSVFGCNSWDDVLIKIYLGPDIYVPTGFTPNGDGVNDILKVTLVGIKTYDGIKIYNRWGKLMYEGTNPEKGWDGIYKKQWADAEAYIFVTSGIDINGKKIVKKGTVVLVR
jgi:gliding motility-associated-like protein